MFCGSKSEKKKQCLAFFRILKKSLQKINLLRLQNPKNKMRFQIAKNDVISWFSMLFDSKNIVFFNDICFALAAYEKKKQKHLYKSSKNSCFWFSKPRKMNFSCFLKSLKKTFFLNLRQGHLKKKNVFSNLKESRVFAGFPSWEKVPMSSGYR